MPFPFLAIAAGVLVAKAAEALLKEEAPDCEYRVQQFRVGCAGLGLVIHTRLTGSAAKNLRQGTLVVRPRKSGNYIKSLHCDFADRDGDIVSGNHIGHEEGGAVASVYIPFCAFPERTAKVDLEIVILRSDGRQFPPQHTQPFELTPHLFDRRNAIAAVCDGAIAAVRLTGDVHRLHISTAKESISAAWALDKLGVKELHRQLKRAVSTDSGSEWFDPHRIAVDIADELSGSDERLVAFNLLYGVAGAKGGVVSGRTDDYLSSIGRLLDVEPDALEALRTRYRVDVHYTVLGLEPGASLEEVKRAFRRIAKLCHPDVVRSLDPAARAAAEERFRVAKQAHDALSASAEAA